MQRILQRWQRLAFIININTLFSHCTCDHRERTDSKSASHHLFYLLTVGVPAASEWFPSPCVLPAACAQSLDYHTASRKLSKQFHHSLRRFTVSRNDDSPFQILSEFF